MNKVAIIVLAGTEGHENLGRVVNAMIAAKEFHEANDDIKLIFDGAATQWINALSVPTHNYHSLFNSIRKTIAGACNYCANAFQVKDKIKEANIGLLDEFEGHPSFRKLMTEGYQIMVF